MIRITTDRDLPKTWSSLPSGTLIEVTWAGIGIQNYIVLDGCYNDSGKCPTTGRILRNLGDTGYVHPGSTFLDSPWRIIGRLVDGE